MLPGVREAVVIVHEERLVAYMTGEAEVEELRRELRERLPEYMVPALFVPLAALPLSPSGKVDRKALPAPDRSPAPGFVAPRTPVEEALAEIWRELLRVQQVGVYESFFELGGHSLLAVLLMARIEKRFGRNLPLAALFGAPTLEALAALLSQAAGQPHRSSLVAIQPHGDRAPLFCVHPVGGNVLCYLDLARHLEPGQPFYALQSPDPGDGIPASVEEMAAGYLRELRSVQPEGPYRLGGWSMGGLVAFEMARQLKRDGQEVEMVALIDTPPPPVEPDRSPVADDDLRAWFALDLAGLPEYAGRISLDDLPPSLFATFASNLRAGRAYARQPYAGSVTLFQAEETSAAHGPDVLEGWRRSALGGVEASTLPGDHYSLLRGAAVERLARELTERLAVARQPVG
jgi:thioesterase domain-containing protein/acyl carrier protein